MLGNDYNTSCGELAIWKLVILKLLDYSGNDDLREKEKLVDLRALYGRN